MWVFNWYISFLIGILRNCPNGRLKTAEARLVFLTDFCGYQKSETKVLAALVPSVGYGKAPSFWWLR